MKTRVAKEWIFGGIIVFGLGAFDIFNFATTQDALRSFLGDAKLLIVPIATALAIAFCAVDLGGLASIFTKEKGLGEPWYVWMLGAGWLVASMANAFLTYWAVLMGMTSAPALTNPKFSAEAVLNVVPVMLAITVWLIRLLIIGSMIVAGNHHRPVARPMARPAIKPGIPQPVAAQPTMRTPVPPKPTTMNFPGMKLEE